MEAESYAHQALKVHGMTMPKRFTEGGRRYVGTWVERDRAKGIPIDPRVLAYVAGTRSPYELLRDIPETWRKAGFKSLPPVAEVPKPVRKPKPAPVAVVTPEPAAAPSVTSPPDTAFDWPDWLRAKLIGLGTLLALAAWLYLLCELFIDPDDDGTSFVAYVTAGVIMLGNILTPLIDRAGELRRWPMRQATAAAVKTGPQPW